jgi:phosphate transport system protein
VVKHLSFNREMTKLQKQFLLLGSMVEEKVRKACGIIEKTDNEIVEELLNSDWEIDEMEVEIEEECLKILALHQPVASDLRYLIAVIKINSELERIGDIAVNIAKRVQTINKDSPLELHFDFSTMNNRVISMLKKSLDALVTKDVEQAREIFLDDELVDRERNKVYRGVTAELDDKPGHAACLLNQYLLSRHLERIGDRCTNIAEEIIYLVEGDIIRGSDEK